MLTLNFTKNLSRNILGKFSILYVQQIFYFIYYVLNVFKSFICKVK